MKHEKVVDVTLSAPSFPTFCVNFAGRWMQGDLTRGRIAETQHVVSSE